MPLIVKKLPIDLTWGKCCPHDNAFNVFQIGFNLAGSQQRREISVEFNYEQNRVIPLGAICP